MLLLPLILILSDCGGGTGTTPLATPVAEAAYHTGDPSPSQSFSPSASISPTPLTTGELALQADSFVDSVGVNTHLHYDATAYVTNYSQIRTDLVNLGVRHIRDGLVDTAWQPFYDHLNDLGRAGIHATLIAGVNDTVATLLDYPNRVPFAIEAYEGPNEYDRSGDFDWVSVLKNYQRLLYTTVKGNVATEKYPVLGPSLTSKSARIAVGNLSDSLDLGSDHDYFSGRNPGTMGFGVTDQYGTYGSIAYYNTLGAISTGGKGVEVTETGYHTEPQSVAAKYVVRALLEHALAGVKRTFIYELIDEGAPGDSGWGLTDATGVPKPAYYALSGLLGLLSDAGPPFVPGRLSYTVANAPAQLHHMLLQKRSGTFYLVLWLEVPGWEPLTSTPIFVAPQTVRLQFAATPRAASTTAFDDTGHGSISTLPASTALTVTVTDRITVIALTP